MKALFNNALNQFAVAAASVGAGVTDSYDPDVAAAKALVRKHFDNAVQIALLRGEINGIRSYAPSGVHATQATIDAIILREEQIARLEIELCCVPA